MKLIGSLASPYVRKTRIAFHEKKIELQFILEDVWSASTQIGANNPLGKVPCLILEDGVSLFDSRVIVEYADGLSPVGHLIPSVGKEKAVVKTWEALGDGILDAAILVRLEKAWAPRGEYISQAWIDRQLDKIQSGLRALSEDLGANPWCFNNHFTLADISVGVTLGYLLFRFPEIKWQESFPNLAQHYEKLSQRPSFIDTPHPV